MLRFMQTHENEDLSECAEDGIILSSDIWVQSRKYFSRHKNTEKILVLNNEKKLICYAYQDETANRELRMLQELMSGDNLIHFHDVYPEYTSVVIYECNELAYFFVQYLRRQNIPVKVMGKYWDEVDQEYSKNEVEGKSLYIYAEGTWEHILDIQEELQRTVAVEFECIDKIYMVNVKKGYICDTKCNLEHFVDELKQRQVILLGIGDASQDAYDVLRGYGVDICAFLIDGYQTEFKLLGKPIINFVQLKQYRKPVLLDCYGVHSTIGNPMLNYLVYHGFLRNQTIFFLKDYVDIPRTNLLRVIQNKSVYLCGDQYHCKKLEDYLKNIHNIDIIGEEELKINEKGTKEILGLIVVPQIFGIDDKKWKSLKVQYRESLKKKNIRDYSEYFCKIISFILIENETEKYTINNLTPKGIIIGAINAFSGNIFFRGCIDNHPQILQFGYTFFERNIFTYCVRLSTVYGHQVFPLFWELLEQDAPLECINNDFMDRGKFQQSCEKFLEYKRKYTSQELFVLFAIAYSEMMGCDVGNVGTKYIYWEPHDQSAEMKARYSKWLVGKKINCFVIWVYRNNVARVGSCLAYMDRKKQIASIKNIINIMLATPDYVRNESEDWENIEVKFEDIKLHPNRIWSDFCHRLNIAWSDNLLITTQFGKEPLNYGNGVAGYDLAPVYRTWDSYLSFLDKMRIEMCTKSYLKHAQYYVDEVTVLSPKEVQELFLKDFKAESLFVFENEEERKLYRVSRANSIQAVLWQLQFFSR